MLAESSLGQTRWPVIDRPETSVQRHGEDAVAGDHAVEKIRAGVP
jgi:hypothetical protein